MRNQNTRNRWQQLSSNPWVQYKNLVGEPILRGHLHFHPPSFGVVNEYYNDTAERSGSPYKDNNGSLSGIFNGLS